MDEDDEIPFTPVPRASRRRDGWTEARQREFIAALARCGSVSAAARQVGKSARGAYALLDHAEAESFERAWNDAVERGLHNTRDCVIDRAMHGGWVPVVRRGRIVRMEFRRYDRLLIAILAGQGRLIDDQLADRAHLRAHRRELREQDRKAAEIRRLNQEALEDAAREKAAAEAKARAPAPRIRIL
jgi:hypothetical protein